MKVTIRTWASKKSFETTPGQTTQVGQAVAEALREALVGQGERPHANLSGADAERLISTIERSGGTRTAAEQKLLDFLRGPASDRRSKSFLQIGGGEVLAVGATPGQGGGRAILRGDELARLAANRNLPPAEPRAELDRRAARVLGGDPALHAQRLDTSLADYLRATGTGAQTAMLEAQRELCLRAAAEFLTGAIASWVENDKPVPAALVGKRLVADDVRTPSPELSAFLAATRIEVVDRGEITRYTEGGAELGAVVAFALRCNGELASWRCFHDARAGYFTTVAVRDGILGPDRTERLDRPR